MHDNADQVIKILLIDDHTIVRSALRSLCLELYPGALLQESADGKGVMELYRNNRYDLIITDIQMPDCDILWLIHSLCTVYPSVNVLVYSMTADNIYAVRVLKAGAKGFVSKADPLEKLIEGIGLALQGKTYIPPEIADMLIRKSFKTSETPFTNLSGRELQIATLLLSGHSVTDISKLLHIGSSTVGTHKGKIYLKLHVANLIELKTLSDVYKFSPV